MSGLFSWLRRLFSPSAPAAKGGKSKAGKPTKRKANKSKAAAKPKLRRKAAPQSPVFDERAAAIAGRLEPKTHAHKLRRAYANPILKPHELNEWETQATFNPAAIAADGKVHLIYRAIGRDNVSVLGYAMSHDGIHISERRAEPAFASPRKEGPRVGEPADYLSGGGGEGGCEDPRLTVIEGVVYLLYTAFDGWNSIRIALSTISLDDFLNRRWNWSEPVLISRPGEAHKNWLLFPERINGKLAVLSNLTPEIRVDYYDSLEALKDHAPKVKLEYTKVRRPKVWDTFVRGGGPPPIKTPHGWLLLYHAVEGSDPGRYKLGAMLLDLDDPTKILCRSRKPILEPDECYENEGFKSGVVYSCGAVVIGSQLFVYYGGADSVTCVAVADLDSFLKELMSGQTPKVRGFAKPKGKTYDDSKALKKKPARLA